jgi:CubicO group peptidase (beta-lactamase class C family)
MTFRRSRNWIREKCRAIAVPEDLAGITRIDREGEVDGAAVGLDEGAVEEIWQHMVSLFNTGMHPLLSLCVRRKGQIVLNRTIGYAAGDAQDPDARVAELDTPICLFSASKSISAMLLHLLAEQGKVHLLDPISYYIPAFAAEGKGNITIYQLLAHRAGVPGLGEDTDPRLLFDRETALELICRAQPIDDMGRVAAYHAITGGFIIDELIRVTTGLDARQYLDRYIRKPMNMRYFRYGLTPRDRQRAARHYATGLAPSGGVERALTAVLGIDLDSAVELSNQENFFDAILPAANIYCTAEEASRFFQMMLDYGSFGGQRVMAPLTVHRATQEAGRAQLDASLKLPMRYSPGFMLGGRPIGIYGRHSHYAYGHLGLSNVFCWADPERELSVALLNTGKPVLGTHLVALPRLLYSIPRLCPPVRDMANVTADYLRA